MRHHVALVLLVVATFGLPSPGQNPAPKETIRQEIGRIRPDFQKEWLRISRYGTLAEFLVLKDSTTAHEPVSMAPPRLVIDVCVDSGLVPWITIADDEATTVEAVRGAWVRTSMFFEFDVPGHNQHVEWKVSDLKARPFMEAVPGEGDQTAILQGFKGKERRPVSGAQINRSLWLHIPGDTKQTEMEITVTADWAGPKEGVARTGIEEKKLVVRVLPAAQPTRENLFCLWLRGVEAGEWLTQFPDGNAEVKKQNQRYVESVHQWFTTFAGNPKLREHSLAKELMAHERYVKAVIPQSSKMKRGSTADQGH